MLIHRAGFFSHKTPVSKVVLALLGATFAICLLCFKVTKYANFSNQFTFTIKLVRPCSFIEQGFLSHKTPVSKVVLALLGATFAICLLCFIVTKYANFSNQFTFKIKLVKPCSFIEQGI